MHSDVIHVIVGLPGSGKTEYASKKFKGWCIIDDADDVFKLPKNGSFVLIDPRMCLPAVFEAANRYLDKHYPAATKHYTFFANDPDQCLTNATNRGTKAVRGAIRLFSQYYAPPKNALPVYKPIDNETETV